METSTSVTETKSAPRKFPLWAWWVIGIAVIIGVASGIIFLIRASSVRIPEELINRRKEVSKILEEVNKIQDVDIRPLVDLEAKKDYRGAVALMEQALARNDEYEKLVASLVGTSVELSKLAVEVKPDDIGTKAIGAFGALANLAQAEKKFYENRRTLYEVTRSYYSDLEAKKNPPIPNNLPSLVEVVNDDLKKANELSGQFAAAVKAFDDAASRK